MRSWKAKKLQKRLHHPRGRISKSSRQGARCPTSPKWLLTSFPASTLAPFASSASMASTRSFSEAKCNGVQPYLNTPFGTKHKVSKNRHDICMWASSLPTKTAEQRQLHTKAVQPAQQVARLARTKTMLPFTDRGCTRGSLHPNRHHWGGHWALVFAIIA